MSCSSIPQASRQGPPWVKQTAAVLSEAPSTTRPDGSEPVWKTSAPPVRRLRVSPSHWLEPGIGTKGPLRLLGDLSPQSACCCTGAKACGEQQKVRRSLRRCGRSAAERLVQRGSCPHVSAQLNKFSHHHHVEPDSKFRGETYPWPGCPSPTQDLRRTGHA